MTLSRRSLLAAIAGLVFAPLALVKADLPGRALKCNSEGYAELTGDFANDRVTFDAIWAVTGSVNDDWFMGHKPGTLLCVGVASRTFTNGRALLTATLRVGDGKPPTGVTWSSYRKWYNRPRFADTILAQMQLAP